MKNLKIENNFFKKSICSLYEVENFLNQYNKITDIIKIIKIMQKHNK